MEIRELEACSTQQGGSIDEAEEPWDPTVLQVRGLLGFETRVCSAEKQATSRPAPITLAY